MQVDVGFGDVIHPDAVTADYPAILEMDKASMRIYPPETVLAEKTQAMVHLGSLTSRMKDFYDIWRLSQQFEFNPAVLREAVRQTFSNRGTEIIPFDELKADLLGNESMQKQWHAFLAKSGVTGPSTFEEVLDEIGNILRPALR